MSNLARMRADFPVLARTVRGGRPLVYLDNAASTQKPQVVIDAVTRFYAERCSNVHRGVHELSELARTAGVEIVGTVLQVRPRPDPRYLVGRGRLEELVVE